MKYSENIDYLVSSILYLGTHNFYWARSPRGMAYELSQDEARLTEVFDAFPAIYRKSKRLSEAGQHYYALQARYAQREGGNTRDPEEVSYIEPLSTEKIRLLLDFVLKMAEHEKLDVRTTVTGTVAILAAIFSAATAVFVALN